jgi:hypothetical protein
VAYEVETTDVDKMASNPCLKAGGLFPETTGFVIAKQEQVISMNNWKECISKDPNITKDICRKHSTYNR